MNRISGLALVASGLLALACAGHVNEAKTAQAAQAHRVRPAVMDAKANHQCVGPVCGPAGMVAEWTLDHPEYALTSGTDHRCVGPVCGPLQMNPTWELEENALGVCRAAVCGPSALPSNWETQYVVLGKAHAARHSDHEWACTSNSSRASSPGPTTN